MSFSMTRGWSAGSPVRHIRTMPWRVLQGPPAAWFPGVGVRVVLEHDPSAHLSSPWVEHLHPPNAGVLSSSGQLSWVDYHQNKKSSALLSIPVAHGNSHIFPYRMPGAEVVQSCPSVFPPCCLPPILFCSKRPESDELDL